MNTKEKVKTDVEFQRELEIISECLSDTKLSNNLSKMIVIHSIAQNGLCGSTAEINQDDIEWMKKIVNDYKDSKENCCD